MEYFFKNPENGKDFFAAPSIKKENPELESLKKWLESQLKAWTKEKDKISEGDRYSQLNKHIAKGRVFMLEEILKQIKRLTEK